MTHEDIDHEKLSPMPPRGRTLHDYLWILFRRRWTVLAVFFMALGIAAYQNFTATPIYRATVQVLIERNLPRVLEGTQTSQYDPYSQDFYQTQYKLLESSALAKKVADRLRLRKHQYFAGIFNNLPPEADEATRQRAEESLVSLVRSGLSVSPVKDSRLVNLNYSDPDPKFAAELANAYAQCYIEQSMDLRFAVAQETANWLQKKLTEARKKLEESESKLNHYKKDQSIVALGDKETITAQKLEQLNHELVSAQARRIEAETRYKEVSQGHAIPAVLNDPLIQALKGAEAKIVTQLSELGKKYGEKHPRIIQLTTELAATRDKIRAEMGNVMQSIKNEYAMAKSHEANVQKAMDAVKNETLDMSSRSIQYRVLLRDVETNRALYENILKNLKETTTIENVPATNIRIVYPAAVPTAPVSPQKSRTLLLGAALGLFFGVGLALLLENLDTTLKSPEDIERRLGLPNLAVIPHLQMNSGPNGSDGIPTEVTQSQGQTMVAEAYRSLRTNIQFSTPGHSPRTILVTSSLPMEGKSLNAVNLAAVMAKGEPHILLVDADLRRPTLHTRFGVSKEPGLTNFLVGEIEEIPASPSKLPNLFLVPCGHISPNPSELLSSQRMRDFLAKASEQFGRVIIDSPPLVSVTDPAIVAAQAEGVLLVVKSETVPRKAAVEARDQLTAVNANLLGTILNDVSFKRDGYYYQHYYRYRNYYTPEEVGSTGKDEPSPVHASGVWSRIKQTVKNGPTLGKN